MNFRLTTLTILFIGSVGLILAVSPSHRDRAHEVFQRTVSILRGVRHNQSDYKTERGVLTGATAPAGLTAGTLGAAPSHGPLGHGRPLAAATPPKLLEQAIKALENYSSISAKTRLSVCSHGKQLVGSGEYLELHSGGRRMLRFELKLQLHDEPSVLLQVCDGRYLWRAESYRGKGTAERIDLAQAAQALEDPNLPMLLSRLPTWPGLGGLPKLLRTLSGRFDFPTAAETVLPDQTPVIRLEGTWKGQALADLASRLPGRSGGADAPNGKKLPEPWPELVHVYLGQEDLFPFRIEYCRRGAGAILEGSTGHQFATVTMDLFEVSLNTPIPPSRFQFNPGNLEYSDRTDRFLQQLGLKKP